MVVFPSICLTPWYLEHYRNLIYETGPCRHRPTPQFPWLSMWRIRREGEERPTYFRNSEPAGARTILCCFLFHFIISYWEKFSQRLCPWAYSSCLDHDFASTCAIRCHPMTEPRKGRRLQDPNVVTIGRADAMRAHLSFFSGLYFSLY